MNSTHLGLAKWVKVKRRASLTIVAVSAVAFQASFGQATKPSVLLPESAAKEVSALCSREGLDNVDGSWRPKNADIVAMESNLWRISKLRSEDGVVGARVRHPERDFRQYVAVVVSGRKLIYINAFCSVDGDPPTYWQSRMVKNCDGGCDWGAIYDPATGRFSHLGTNGIG
jgi:hypothetical protein